MPIINQVVKGGGTTPTGTKSITANGVYDVTDFASADVQVPTTAPEYYVKLAKSSSGQLSIASDSPVINMSGIKDIASYTLARAYYNNSLVGNEDWSSVERIFEYGCHQCFEYSTITSIDLSSLKTVNSAGAQQMFSGCNRLQTNINLSSLTSVLDNGLFGMFDSSKITGLDMSGLVSSNFRQCYRICADCSNLTSVDLSSFTNANGSESFGSAFVNCTALTSIDLNSLTTVSGASCCQSMFEGCTALTSIDLSSLTTVSGNYGCAYMFNNCTTLTSPDLRGLTTISGTSGCAYMFNNCTALTSADLSGLTTVTGNYCCQSMFEGCTSLQTVDLRGIQNYGDTSFYNTFNGCTSLERVVLGDVLKTRNPPSLLDNVGVRVCEYADSLEYFASNSSVGLCRGNKFATADMKKFELVNVSVSYMFANNTDLTDIKFPVLTRWNGLGYATSMFSGCTNTNFTDVSFPMLCVFRNAVPFTTTSFPSQATVHFRKDQQTIIMGTAGASSNFGAAALVFDQIGTITVGGVDYIRQGRCNETGYYAWQKASSNITVNGVVYTFSIAEITRNSYGSGATTTGDILYGWKNGSTTIFTNTLKPQVGDYIWTAFNVAQSTTPIDAVDNEYVYTVDSAEPDVGDTVYSDAQGTVLGTISAVA